MSESVVRRGAKDDSGLDYSDLRARKDDWVRRKLSVDVKSTLNRHGLDPVAKTANGGPDKEKFAEEQVTLIRSQVAGMLQTLSAGPHQDVPEAVKLRQEIADFSKTLGGAKPDINGLRKRLGELQKAVPVATAAMEQAALGVERERLIKAAKELSTQLDGQITGADVKSVQEACGAVGAAMPSETPTKEAVEQGTQALSKAGEVIEGIKTRLKALNEIRDKLIERNNAVKTRLDVLNAAGIKEADTAGQLQAKAQQTITVLKFVSTTVNEAIEKAVKLAEDAVGVAEKVAAPLVKRRELLGQKLASATSPTDTLPDTLEALQKQREKAETALGKPLSAKGLDLAEKEIEALLGQIGRAASEKSDLGGDKGLETLLKPFGGDQKALDGAFGDRTGLRKLTSALGADGLLQLSGKLGGGDPVKGAAVLKLLGPQFGPAELPALADKLGGDALTTLASGKGGAKRAKELCDAFTPELLGPLLAKTSDPDLPNKLLTQLGNKPAALTRLATKGGFDKSPDAFVALITKGCGSDPAKFSKLCTGLTEKDDLPRLKKLLEEGGLGDAPDAFGDLVGIGVDDGKTPIAQGMKGFLKAFDGDKERANLKRVLEKGGLKGRTGTSGETTIDPGCLGHLLASGHTAEPPKPDLNGRCEGLKTLLAGLDESACTKMSGMLEKSGLGAAPGAFAGVVGAGCDGDPKALGTVTETFSNGANQVAMKRALTTGGLQGKTDTEGDTLIDPGCLGHLLRGGQPGEPAPPIANRANGLAGLLKGLDESACGKLEGVLSEGGMGQAPRGLGALVGDIGCGGKAADLKTFLGSFDDKDSREALKRGVLEGGLAGVEDDEDNALVDPSCLAHILKNGHKEPTPPAQAPDLKTRCDGLKTLLKGLDEDACSSIQALMVDGGLGGAPEVMGHVVGLGCDGDPDKLSKLGGAFSDSKSRQKLEAMIGKGGFGPTKADGKASGVNPECLGRLLGTGCEGKPAELKKLATQLSPTDLEGLEGVMSGGTLGKNPKVLAKLYKHGCLVDPNGKDDGPKNPKVLSDMVGGFNVKGGPAAFKDLLDNGGLGSAGDNHDRLGSVVRYAFTPKRPDDGKQKKQESGKLKTLQESFNGNMADLRTMVDAISTAPDTILKANTTDAPGNQPGKGLQNIVHAPRFQGDPSRVQQDFFKTLENRAPPNPPAGNPGRLSKVALLQNAASFEHDPMGDTREEISGYSVRTGHVKLRHTRKYNNLDCNSWNNNAGVWVANKTTLYDRADDTDADVTERVENTLDNLANKPTDGAALVPYGGFAQTFGTSDGKGCTSQTGFAKEGSKAAVTQFVPESGTTINSHDMKALGMALRTDRDNQYV